MKIQKIHKIRSMSCFMPFPIRLKKLIWGLFGVFFSSKSQIINFSKVDFTQFSFSHFGRFLSKNPTARFFPKKQGDSAFNKSFTPLSLHTKNKQNSMQ